MPYKLNITVFNRYRELTKFIQDTVLREPLAVKKLEDLCKIRIEKKQSLAKLTIDYSNKIRGLNNNLSTKVLKCLILKDWSNINLDTGLVRQLEVSVSNKSLKKEIKSYREEISGIESLVTKLYQPLSLYIANKYCASAYGFDRDDLIQEANKGVLKAIEKYNPRFLTREGKPVKFITYVYISASDKIKEYIMNQSRMVRIPKSKLERIFILIEANKKTSSIDPQQLSLSANTILHRRLNRKLKKLEIFTIKEVEELSYIMRGNSVSFDVPLGKRKENLVDLLPGNSTEFEKIEQSDHRIEIKKALREVLTEPEYKVIFYKFFFNGDEVSLEETQKSFQMYENIEYSRERINQLKNSALEKLMKDTNLIEMLRK